MGIRSIGESDADAAARLVGELGYPLTPRRPPAASPCLLRAPDHRTWVYEDEGIAVGLLHAFYRPAFDHPPEVMVQALVVATSHRSRGVGEALMKIAGRWAIEIGSGSASLYSRIDRHRAHQFYERLGYGKASTSNRQSKTFKR